MLLLGIKNGHFLVLTLLVAFQICSWWYYIPVNTTRNKSEKPPEELRPENSHFLFLGATSQNC